MAAVSHLIEIPLEASSVTHDRDEISCNVSHSHISEKINFIFNTNLCTLHTPEAHFTMKLQS